MQPRYPFPPALVVAFAAVLVSPAVHGDEAPAVQPPTGYETEEAHERLTARTAASFDPSLPDIPFEEWLREILPPGVGFFWEIDDCGEQTGDPQADSAREIPRCLSVTVEVVSRARTLALSFLRDDLSFRDGVVYSDELEGTVRLRSLTEVDAALKKPLRPHPLTCPEGTALRVQEEYAGLREWCESPAGRKHGPYRAWYSTGIYVMGRGRFANNAEIGDWLVCSRFERCSVERFGND